MCGLFGVAGSLYKQELDKLRELAVLSYIRGKDSSGVGAVFESQRTRTKIFKGTFDIFELMKEAKFSDVVAGNKCVILGHTRAATVGKIEPRNAHPFEHGNILGTHNGTLSYQVVREFLKDQFKLDFETDSEALIALIDRVGVKEAFSYMRGAWAVVWYDKRLGTLNMLRNKERPLFFQYADNRKVIYYASEERFLDFALGGEKDTTEIYEVQEDGWLQWQVPKKGKPFDKPRLAEVKSGTVPLKPYTSSGTQTNRGAYGSNNHHYETYTSKNPVNFETEVLDDWGITVEINKWTKRVVGILTVDQKMTKQDEIELIDMINKERIQAGICGPFETVREIAQRRREENNPANKHPRLDFSSTSAGGGSSGTSAGSTSGPDASTPDARQRAPLNLAETFKVPQNWTSGKWARNLDVANAPRSELPNALQRGNEKNDESVGKLKVPTSLSEAFESGTRKQKSTNQSTVSDKPGMVLSYKHPRGRPVVDPEEFETLTSLGCSGCSSETEWGEPIEFIRMGGSEREWLCSKCAENPILNFMLPQDGDRGFGEKIPNFMAKK